MSVVIHSQELPEGEITVFSNGDYMLVEGDPDSVDAISTYHQSGHGPYRLQLFVERIVATYTAMSELTGERGVGDAEGRRPARAAVRGLSVEDEEGVPVHMRSSASRFRADLRLERDTTREAELLRRRRLAVALQLGERLGRLHAHLQHLINTEADSPRYNPEPMAVTGTLRWQPSELQIAILSGLVVEGRPPMLADVHRGIGNDILDLLAAELPGFQTQYENVYARESERITTGLLQDVVLAVIDILDAVITLGASLAITATRRMFSTSANIIRRETIHAGERAIVRSADDVISPGTAVRPRDVAPDTPGVAPRRAGTGGAVDPEAPLARRGAVAEEPAAPQTRRGAAAEEPVAPRTRPPESTDTVVDLSDSTFNYSGPLPAIRETALRERFGVQRLQNMLDGFRRLDEFLPEAIRRVVERTGRGGRRARADVALERLERELREIVPDRAMRPDDALSAAQRTEAMRILAEARRVARGRWDTLRSRLWRELYAVPEVQRALLQMQREGLIRLPRGFPSTTRPPSAIGGNRDGIMWLRSQEGVPSAEIGREFGLSAEAVDQQIARIRRSIAAGDPAPSPISELPVNLDHITPLQLNPFNFFHPNNLRVINASYNDTWLRLYQMHSAFPMTDDVLEAWIRAFRLW